MLHLQVHNEEVPPDFWKLQTHKGYEFSNSLELCFKKGPANPLDQTYKPIVVDRYPRNDSICCPLPVAVAQVTFKSVKRY
jgi:hypothetical protein